MGIQKDQLGHAKGPTGTNFQPVGALKESNRNTMLHENFLIQGRRKHYESGGSLSVMGHPNC